MTEVQDALGRMEVLDFERYVRELREARQRGQVGVEPVDEYHQNHPGHPLGVGMPLGAPIREDESHNDGWKRIIRRDPCSFCGAPGGTLDHITPQKLRLPHTHDWTNYAGACECCNGKKANQPLLQFLGKRRGLVFPRDRRAA